MGKRKIPGMLVVGILCVTTLMGCTQNKVEGEGTSGCTNLPGAGGSLGTSIYKCEYENGDYCYVSDGHYSGGISCYFSKVLQN